MTGSAGMQCDGRALVVVNFVRWLGSVSFNNASAITAPILYIGAERRGATNAALCADAQYFLLSYIILYCFLYVTIVYMILTACRPYMGHSSNCAPRRADELTIIVDIMHTVLRFNAFAASANLRVINVFVVVVVV